MDTTEDNCSRSGASELLRENFRRATCSCERYCGMLYGITRCASKGTGPVGGLGRRIGCCLTQTLTQLRGMGGFCGMANCSARTRGQWGRSVTIVRARLQRESQCRILYSPTLPSLVCDFFEVTATIGREPRIIRPIVRSTAAIEAGSRVLRYPAPTGQEAHHTMVAPALLPEPHRRLTLPKCVSYRCRAT